jgi:hypothetical protein
MQGRAKGTGRGFLGFIGLLMTISIQCLRRTHPPKINILCCCRAEGKEQSTAGQCHAELPAQGYMQYWDLSSIIFPTIWMWCGKNATRLYYEVSEYARFAGSTWGARATCPPITPPTHVPEKDLAWRELMKLWKFETPFFERGCEKIKALFPQSSFGSLAQLAIHIWTHPQ